MDYPCNNNESECDGDAYCKNKLLCGDEDKICQTNCSVKTCDFQEGVCLTNDECKGELICGVDKKCRGNKY